VLTKHDFAMTRKIAPNAKIGSFYGATETQRAVGYFEIPEDLATSDEAGMRAVPLGRGIKDVQLLLLTPSRQLAGIGELASSMFEALTWPPATSATRRRRREILSSTHLPTRRLTGFIEAANSADICPMETPNGGAGKTVK
jgi:hypothetical protein